MMIEITKMMIEMMIEITTTQFIAMHQCSESSNLICRKHLTHDDGDDNDDDCDDNGDDDDDDYDNAM